MFVKTTDDQCETTSFPVNIELGRSNMTPEAQFSILATRRSWWWHNCIAPISREVEFSGCPGTRQCLGPRMTGIRVKVERRLVLLCSCAVQREVFLVWQFSGKFFSCEGIGQGITGECIILSRCAMQGFGARFLSVYEVSLLLSTWHCTCKCQTLME